MIESENGLLSSKPLGVLSKLTYKGNCVKTRSIILFLAIIITSCSKQNLISLTTTPIVTSTPIPTTTPQPTSTNTPYPTQDPLDMYLSLLPPLPTGFEWKMAEDLNVVMAMPRDWFYSREYCPTINMFDEIVIPMIDVEQVCISKENPLEVGKYSTGQSVIVYKNIEDPEGFQLHILNILATSPNFGLLLLGTDTNEMLSEFPPEIYKLDIHFTTSVIDGWERVTDLYTIRHLRVEAEYPHETGNNTKKIVQYSTSSFKNTVMLMIFESPADIWDETLEEYGPTLDYLVFLGQ